MDGKKEGISSNKKKSIGKEKERKRRQKVKPHSEGNGDAAKNPDSRVVAKRCISNFYDGQIL